MERTLQTYTRGFALSAFAVAFWYLAYLMRGDPAIRGAIGVLVGFAGSHVGSFACLFLMLALAVFIGE